MGALCMSEDFFLTPSSTSTQESAEGKNIKQNGEAEEAQNALREETFFAQVPKQSFSDVSHNNAGSTNLNDNAVEVIDAMKSVFTQLDTDNNEFISKAEINKALLDPKYKGIKALALKIMKSDGDTLQTLSNDEWGYENDGISKKDLDKFAEQYPKYAKEMIEALNLSSLGIAHFNEIDKDGDNFISKGELNNAIDTRLFKDDSSEELLKAIKKKFDDLKNVSNDEWGHESSVTKLDFLNFGESIGAKYDYPAGFRPLGLSFGVDKHLLPASNELFANRNDPVSSVRPEAIEQGNIGDCAYMSAVGAMAASNQGKQQILNMIREVGIDKNGSKIFEVKFPGLKGEKIEVVEPIDAEKLLYAQQTPYGIWPLVLEKAYAIHMNGGKTDTNSPVQETLHAGGVNDAHDLEVLTGKAAHILEISARDKDNIHKILTASVADGKPLTATIYGADATLYGQITGESKSDDTGLPAKHRYSLIGYDAEKQIITFMDPKRSSKPYGQVNDPSLPHGVFTLTLDRYIKNFSTLNYVDK